MTTKTKISVRALAFGGKFVGQHVGFAKIAIYGPDDADKPLASGLTDHGLVAEHRWLRRYCADHGPALSLGLPGNCRSSNGVHR